MTKIYFLFLCFITFANAQDYKKDTIELHETILYDKSKFRLKRVGSDTKTKSILIGLTADINFSKDSLPKFTKEFAIPINAPKKEFTFQRINFNFSNSLKLDSILLKVDLTAMNNGKPAQSILEKPFEVVVKKEYQQNDVFSMDLRDLNIKYQDDFFIKVELLTEVEKPIYFSGALLAKCLYKTTDSDVWMKTPLGITPAINADLLIKR
ncbi:MULTISPECIES: hypothetical protein [Empedobacter]|uniref:Uncharacterized protein n=1 Tax=Empedobacter falsenii TaxID=343874 RepID=A0A7H9DNS2_9FLAO|nr:MULTISPECIES: hypothetical protein [Empedobacter]QLL56808.1 hypothetical protein FH779_01335 [Empedobacter falsenii]